MGKKIIVVTFLLTSCASVLLYFFRSSATLRDRLQAESSEPLLIAEDFAHYRYHNHNVISTASGKLAHFIEPNALELYGKLRGFRHDPKNNQYVFAESAVLIYRANTFHEFANSPELETAEMETDIRIVTDGKVLTTEYAKYSSRMATMRSQFPVEIRSSDSQINSKKGFEYNLKSNDLQLFGPIQGYFQGDK